MQLNDYPHLLKAMQDLCRYNQAEDALPAGDEWPEWLDENRAEKSNTYLGLIVGNEEEWQIFLDGGDDERDAMEMAGSLGHAVAHEVLNEHFEKGM